MGRSHNDEYGYKRGLGAYSDCNDGLTSKPDDGNKPTKDIGGLLEVGRADYTYVDPGLNGPNWRPGPLPHKGDSSPRYSPKGDAGTKPAAAASPSGRYAKTGGRGKGFGS